jgi:anaphase-promoting complex subunit 3
MEWYSTVLWHLDDRAELSRLSQDLMTLDRSCAQTWIAIGNSFALQGEHDQAVRCFKRASLVDPGMAYTWTLTAYEALEMEEFDRAISYYQTAVRTDVRHYYAW